MTLGSWASDDNLALFTDLYELTMLQAYFEGGMHEEAVFSLFVRRLPRQRNYLLACGLDDVLHYLETLRFTPPCLEYLASTGQFREPFLQYLADFRFEGEVYAVPEGTPVFANEPILEIVAPLPQAQLAETLVMNQVHFASTAASKAARVVTAARGRRVVDFGARRMHGTDAAVKAARAFHIAGVDATSNVLAGMLYGIPIAGTMAHSFIQAFDSEAEALRAFARVYPETVLLVDTYDTLAGVEKVIALAGELGDDFHVRAVRLDSGDLAELAKGTRARLDAAGLNGVGIFVSGGLDEAAIADLLGGTAPIDGFGVGTAMGVSEDVPALDIAYKLAAYAGRGRLKLSAGKPVLPGRKQVFRFEEDGRAVRDVIGRWEEALAGRPLLAPVMRAGERLPAGRVDLQAAREHARAERERLPSNLLGLEPADPAYPVTVSPELTAYQDKVRRSLSP
jgi:nicotinate phosphoribosyltransferase